MKQKVMTTAMNYSPEGIREHREAGYILHFDKNEAVKYLLNMTYSDRLQIQRLNR